MTTIYLLGAGTEIDKSIQSVQVNQVVQMEGYEYDCYVVYEAEQNGSGWLYQLINLCTLDLRQADIIRPLKEKFGIGFYVDTENPKFKTAQEVADLLERAKAKKSEEKEAKAKEKERVQALKAIGRERLKALLPASAQAVIIACERVDESDAYTDYFAAATVRTVILGFSTNVKNSFPEMRNLAGNFSQTAYLSEANREYEHRENYTGGYGYYLGKSSYSGWVIRKMRIYQANSFIEDYAYTAGFEENICLGSTIEAEPTESVEGEFILVDYTEKAIAVFGDTKAIKERLKALGGRYNRFLTYKEGKRAGWIFSKSKEAELRQLINQ